MKTHLNRIQVRTIQFLFFGLLVSIALNLTGCNPQNRSSEAQSENAIIQIDVDSVATHGTI